MISLDRMKQVASIWLVDLGSAQYERLKECISSKDKMQ
jgi:hypothetical protein